MKRTLQIAALALVASAVTTPDARAQMQWTDQGFVNVNIGAQAPSRDLTTTTTFDIYGEAASQSSIQDVGGGAFFDISAGYKIWRNLAVGAGITRVGSEADLVVDAQIPDPNFFDRPRSVTTTLNGAGHGQTAINLTGTWMMPVTDKVDVGFQFGPTIFLVSQDLPGAIQVAEPGPTVQSASLNKVDQTTLGVHFGADVTYMVTPRFGAGGMVRYSVGSVDLDDSSDGLTVGGFQIGIGARVRF